MAAVSLIGAAEAVETKTPLAARAVPGEQLTGWAVALVPANGSAADLAAQLLTGTQAVAARVDESRVLIELRSVAPKYDLALVDAVMALASPSVGSATESATP